MISRLTKGFIFIPIKLPNSSESLFWNMNNWIIGILKILNYFFRFFIIFCVQRLLFKNVILPGYRSSSIFHFSLRLMPPPSNVSVLLSLASQQTVSVLTRPYFMKTTKVLLSCFQLLDLAVQKIQCLVLSAIRHFIRRKGGPRYLWGHFVSPIISTNTSCWWTVASNRE